MPKISVTNHEAVQALLDVCNGTAAMYVYYPADMVRLAHNAELLLAKRGIPKGERKGVKVFAVSEVPTSKAYAKRSRQAIATRVVLERGASVWFLTFAERTNRWTGPSGRESIFYHITESQANTIKAHALIGFAIHAQPKEEPNV